jgi:murein DD-endopeptidase MepM/ murein hydrolase activator NlpD
MKKKPMRHPLPWNRDARVGVGVDFGRVPRYPGGWHKGIDMHAPVGEGVFAVLDGTVIRAEDTEGDYGIRVDIDHGDGLVTVYAHLDDWLVDVGDEVIEGEIIGYCGNTGNSKGPHLHFEVLLDGELQDPMLWIKPRPEYYAAAWLRKR